MKSVIALTFAFLLGMGFTNTGHSATPSLDVKATSAAVDAKTAGAAADGKVELAPTKPNPKSIKVRINKVSLKGIPASVGSVMLYCRGYIGEAKAPGSGGMMYGGYGVGGGDLTIDQRDPEKQTKPFDVEGGPYDLTLYPNNSKLKPEDIDPLKHLGCGVMFFVHNGPIMEVGYEASYKDSKILEGADVTNSWKLVKNFP